VTISGFDRNVLPFLSVLVFSGMKTGSIRVPTKSTRNLNINSDDNRNQLIG